MVLNEKVKNYCMYVVNFRAAHPIGVVISLKITNVIILMVLEETCGDHQSHQDSLSGNHECLYIIVSINPVDVEMFHCINIIFELLVVLDKKKSSPLVIRIHPPGTINIYTKFHGNPFYTCVSRLHLLWTMNVC